MENVNPNQVINGIDGDCWIDDAKMAEVSEFEANIKMTYTDIPLAHKLVSGKKLTKVEQTGKLHMYDISKVVAKKVAEAIEARKTPVFQVTGKIDDPDSIGPTRVSLSGVKFDEIPLLKWKRGEVTEIDLTFSYESYKYEPAV
ncbi:MAG: phage tail tube protein [Methanobacteriaceae archaeon]|nr:phage tail tube protein [Methanobacteriaceae archaeon]